MASDLLVRSVRPRARVEPAHRFGAEPQRMREQFHRRGRVVARDGMAEF